MALILDGLTKTFSSFPAVNNLSYTMDTGVYGLLGVNGAGKTTLMRMLCTLLTPTSGTITWDGQDIFSLGSAYRNLLGYLPQDFGYYPDFSVQDYLLYTPPSRPAPGHRPAEDAKPAGAGGAHPGPAAENEKALRRHEAPAGIAQAMLNDPKILILDEPTAGLDPKEQLRFRNLISELAENRLVLLSTHIVSDVEYIADQILLMKDGSLVHHGTSQQLLAAAPTQVWTCTVPRAQADQLLHQYPVVNLKTLPQGVQLRVLSQTPPTPEAQPGGDDLGGPLPPLLWRNGR